MKTRLFMFFSIVALSFSAAAYDLRVIPKNNKAVLDLGKAMVVRAAEGAVKQFIGEDAELSEENLRKVIDQLKQMISKLEMAPVEGESSQAKQVAQQKKQLEQLIDQFEALIESGQWNPEIYAMDAYEGLIGALQYEPLMPSLHFNLAQVYSVNKEGEKAIKEYNSVISDPRSTPSQKLAANFNAGNQAAQDSKIELALKYYQAALDLNPDSIEVKTNIEMLWRQQQGGGGGGDSENKEGEGEGEGDQEKDGQRPDNPNYGKNSGKAQEFRSQELSKNDVRKILDELLNQEQEIRAKEYDKKPKEKPRGKDW